MTSSCQKERTVAPSAVHTLHSPTPNAMTALRDFRSPNTPSGRAASDNTMTYADPTQPSCWSERISSRLIGSNSAKTTLRSV